MGRALKLFLLMPVFAIACAAPTSLPHVQLDGTYESTGPVVREGSTYDRASIAFTPDGYWAETDLRSVNAAFYSNGTYDFDGTSLVLKTTLSWQSTRTAVVHNDTITLRDLTILTLIR